MPILKFVEQTLEEIEHAIQPHIDTAMGEAFNDFPTHIGGKDLPDDLRIPTRFVKPPDNRHVVICVLGAYGFRTFGPYAYMDVEKGRFQDAPQPNP